MRALTVTLNLYRRVQKELRNFGHKQFLPDQLAIIIMILLYRDVLAILGTNQGKSLCWQIPALIFRGVTLVITPHKSLMVDQVTRFNKIIPGKKSAYINGDLSSTARGAVLDGVQDRQIKLLYITPEQLQKDDIQHAIRMARLTLLVVDECHCVVADSTYRDSYLLVGHYAKQLGARQIACFSATVPDGFVQDTIIDLLDLDDPIIIRGNLNRPNHYYEVISMAENFSRNQILKQLLAQLKQMGYGRGIIYCARKDDVPHLLGFLKNWGFSSTSYVGSLTTKREQLQNQRNQDLFASGKRQVLVATKAFELGIDVPDVRFVIAYNVPASLSNLFQQMGRGGRDDKPCYCIALYAPQDRALQKVFLKGNLQNLREYRRELPRSIKRKVHLRQWKAHLLAEQKAVQHFVENSTSCIRELLLESQNRELKRRPRNCCGICDGTSRKSG